MTSASGSAVSLTADGQHSPAAPVQQPYQRGSLDQRIQIARDAATVEEFNRHKRVQLVAATLLDGVAKQQAEAMARNVYDRTGAMELFERVQQEIVGVAEALREQIVSPAENEQRKVAEAAHV